MLPMSSLGNRSAEGLISRNKASLYASLLRQCNETKDLRQGTLLHSRIARAGADADTFLGNHLAQMYGSCGSIDEAKLAFDKTRPRNAYSWNILVGVYSLNGDLHSAKMTFDRAPQHSVVSATNIVLAMTQHGELERGRQIFAETQERNVVCWNVLVTAYTRVGYLQEARELFEFMPQRSLVSWNTMIAAYAAEGYAGCAAELFERAPDRNTMAWNSMITAYGRSRQVGRAKAIFEMMPSRDLVSWTSMLTVYFKDSSSTAENARALFHRMPQWNMSSSTTMIQALTSIEESRAVFEEMPQKNPAAWTAMIVAYTEAGRLPDAEAGFDRMAMHDSVSWTAMLSGYAQNGRVQEAVGLFSRMPQRNIVAWNSLVQAHVEAGLLEEARSRVEDMPCWDVVSWTSVLCGLTDDGRMDEASDVFHRVMAKRNAVSWQAMAQGYALKGRVQETESVCSKMPEQGIFCWTALLQSYLQAERTPEAKRLFDAMPQRDSACWNVLLQGYARSGCQAAEVAFHKMPQWSACSWSSLLQAFLHSGRLAEVKELLLEHGGGENPATCTALVAAYAQAGQIRQAREIFDSGSSRDSISWNSMIQVYTESGTAAATRQAVNLVTKMDHEGDCPDEASCSGAMNACAKAAVLPEGRRLHASLNDAGIVTSSVVVATAVVTMYARCGHIDEARAVFDSMTERDGVCWSVMVEAYAHSGRGRGREALLLFWAMQLEGLLPDAATFVSLLSACNHGGKLSDGVGCFRTMVGDYGIVATKDHYACLVDLLARNGRLSEAEEVVEKMPFESREVGRMSLLSACRSHGDVARGERVATAIADHDVDGRDDAIRTTGALLSSIYVSH